MLKKGLKFFENGKYIDAIKVFNNLNEETLNDKEKDLVYLTRGKSHYLKKNYLLAFHDFKWYLYRNPTDKYNFINLCSCIMSSITYNGKVYFKNFYRETLYYFYICTHLNPQFNLIYFWQARFIFSFIKEFKRNSIFDPWKEILRLINISIDLDNLNCRYYAYRGMIYFNLGKFDKALNDSLYSNELFKKFNLYRKSLEGKKFIIVDKNENLHLGYYIIAKCYLMKKQYLLFNKYLSIATNCNCKSCTSNLNLKLKTELNLIKFQKINRLKSQIFQKNLTKW